MDFYDDFKTVRNDTELKFFLKKYGFHEVAAAARWNLGQYELHHEGITYSIGYRWHDPSQAFSIQSDIHKAELWTTDATGNRISQHQIEFPEDA